MDDPEDRGSDAVTPSEGASAPYINEDVALATVAQAESTRSFFLAQTLESTKTVPVVSAKLPLDRDAHQRPQTSADGGQIAMGTGDEAAGESLPTVGTEAESDGQPEADEDSDESDLAGGAVSGASMVVGSFTYRGLTYAVEPGGESVAVVAVDHVKLPSDFLEAQTIVLPSVVSPDGIDSYSVGRIAEGAFSNLTVAVAEGSVDAAAEGETIADRSSADAGNSSDGSTATDADDTVRVAFGLDGSNEGSSDATSDARSDNEADIDEPSDAINTATDDIASDEASSMGITAITIPASITTIEGDAFRGFETLRYVIVSSDNPNYSMHDGCLYDEPMESLLLIPEGRAGAVRILSQTLADCERALSHCARVTSVILDTDRPDTVASGDATITNLTNAKGEPVEVRFADDEEEPLDDVELPEDPEAAEDVIEEPDANEVSDVTKLAAKSGITTLAISTEYSLEIEAETGEAIDLAAAGVSVDAADIRCAVSNARLSVQNGDAMTTCAGIYELVAVTNRESSVSYNAITIKAVAAESPTPPMPVDDGSDAIDEGDEGSDDPDDTDDGATAVDADEADTALGGQEPDLSDSAVLFEGVDTVSVENGYTYYLSRDLAALGFDIDEEGFDPTAPEVKETERAIAVAPYILQRTVALTDEVDPNSVNTAVRNPRPSSLALSGALPTTDNASNTDFSKAGWKFEETDPSTGRGKLTIWSSSGVSVADFGWLYNGNGGGADDTAHWGPLRAYVTSVDTLELSGAASMQSWFARMVNLTNIDDLRVPDGSKGTGAAGIPLSISSLLFRTSSLSYIPLSFYIPDGVARIYRLFCYSAVESFADGFSLPNTLGSDLASTGATFETMTNLRMVPGSLLSRITDGGGKPYAWRWFNACPALTSLGEGFSLLTPSGVSKVSTASQMFINCPELTYLPASFSLKGVTGGQYAFGNAAIGQDTVSKYDPPLVTYWGGSPSELDSKMTLAGSGSATQFWSDNFGRTLVTSSSSVSGVLADFKVREKGTSGWVSWSKVYVPEGSTAGLNNPGAPYGWDNWFFTGWGTDPDDIAGSKAVFPIETDIPSTLYAEYVRTSGALPMTTDANNDDAAKAGWRFDTTDPVTGRGKLTVWSSSGVSVADFGWRYDGNGSTLDDTAHWGPLRAYVTSVDTLELSGAVSMQAWFARMANLTDINDLRVPDGSKGTGSAGIPVSISSLLKGTTGLKYIPASFYIPDGVQAIYRLFQSSGIELFADSFSLPNTLNSSQTATGATFEAMTNLRTVPGSLFSRITDGGGKPYAWRWFNACPALTSLGEGFSLLTSSGVSKVSTASQMFINCPELTYLPASFSLKGVPGGQYAFGKTPISENTTTQYDPPLITYWGGSPSELDSKMTVAGSGSATQFWLDNFGRALVVEATSNSGTLVELNVREKGTTAWTIWSKVYVPEGSTAGLNNPGAPYGWDNWFFTGWGTDSSNITDSKASFPITEGIPTKLYAEYVRTSGALPTTADANNDDAAKAGWRFDTTDSVTGCGKLTVWSSSGVSVADFGWLYNGNSGGADDTAHWGPLRAYVTSVDTLELSGAASMQSWFARMINLTNIDDLRVPDGSKGTGSAGIPVSISSLLKGTTGLKYIPASFYIPDGVQAIYRLFQSSGIELFADSFSLPNTLSSSQTATGATFEAMGNLRMVPGSLFSRITDGGGKPYAWRWFNACPALTSLGEGFSLLTPSGVSKVSTASQMFLNCPELTYLPASFSLKGVTGGQYAFGNVAIGQDTVTKYDPPLVTYWGGSPSELDSKMTLAGSGSATQFWSDNFGRTLMVATDSPNLNVYIENTGWNNGSVTGYTHLIQPIDNTDKTITVPYDKAVLERSGYYFYGFFLSPYHYVDEEIKDWTDNGDGTITVPATYHGNDGRVDPSGPEHDITVLYGCFGGTITYGIDYELEAPEGASTEVQPAENPASYNVTDTVVFAEPTLEGYTFEGWFEKSADGTIAEEPTLSLSGEVGDKAFVGKWTPNEYETVWDYNGPSIAGETFATTTQTFDAPIVSPADPTWTGYAFAGWWTTDGADASDLGEQVDTSATYVTASASTYFARWEKRTGSIVYAATDGGVFPADLALDNFIGDGTYDLLSAELAPGNASVAAEYDIASAIPLAPFAPVRTDGWTFKGWSRDGETVLSALSPEDLWDADAEEYESCTLESLWCQDFSVTYENVDGAYLEEGEPLVLEPSSYNELTGASARVLPTALLREGYVFEGWTLDPQADPVVKQTAIADDATGDLTFYAIWRAVGYDIALDLDSGAWADNSETRTELSTNYDIRTVEVPVSAVAKAGNRAFLGWRAYDAEGNEANVLVEKDGAWIPYTRYLAPGETYCVVNMGSSMPDVAKLKAMFSDAINVSVPIDVNLDVTADFVTKSLLWKATDGTDEEPFAKREFVSYSSGDVVIAEVADDPTGQAERLAAASAIFGKRSPTAYGSVYLTFGADDETAVLHELQLGGAPITVSSQSDRAELTMAGTTLPSGSRLPVRFGMRFEPSLTDADLDIGQVSVPILKLCYKVALADDGAGNPSYPSTGIPLEPPATA